MQVSGDLSLELKGLPAAKVFLSKGPGDHPLQYVLAPSAVPCLFLFVASTRAISFLLVLVISRLMRVLLQARAAVYGGARATRAVPPCTSVSSVLGPLLLRHGASLPCPRGSCGSSTAQEISRLADWYARRAPSVRTVEEVIPAGRPLKLHAHLEFLCNLNPARVLLFLWLARKNVLQNSERMQEAKVGEMVARLKAHIAEQWTADTGSSLSAGDWHALSSSSFFFFASLKVLNDVHRLELDASVPGVKVSRRLVHTSAVFASNEHLYAFMKVALVWKSHLHESHLMPPTARRKTDHGPGTPRRKLLDYHSPQAWKASH